MVQRRSSVSHDVPCMVSLPAFSFPHCNELQYFVSFWKFYIINYHWRKKADSCSSSYSTPWNFSYCSSFTRTRVPRICTIIHQQCLASLDMDPSVDPRHHCNLNISVLCLLILNNSILFRIYRMAMNEIEIDNKICCRKSLCVSGSYISRPGLIWSTVIVDGAY